MRRRIFMQNMANFPRKSGLEILELKWEICHSKRYRLLLNGQAMHQNELMQNWSSLSEKGNGSFIKIEPLK